MRRPIAALPLVLPGAAAAHPGDHAHGEEAGLLSVLAHLADAADPVLAAAAACAVGVVAWAAFGRLPR